MSCLNKDVGKPDKLGSGLTEYQEPPVLDVRSILTKFVRIDHLRGPSTQNPLAGKAHLHVPLTVTALAIV